MVCKPSNTPPRPFPSVPHCAQSEKQIWPDQNGLNGTTRKSRDTDHSENQLTEYDDDVLAGHTTSSIIHCSFPLIPKWLIPSSFGKPCRALRDGVHDGGPTLGAERFPRLHAPHDLCRVAATHCHEKGRTAIRPIPTSGKWDVTPARQDRCECVFDQSDSLHPGSVSA